MQTQEQQELREMVRLTAGEHSGGQAEQNVDFAALQARVDSSELIVIDITGDKTPFAGGSTVLLVAAKSDPAAPPNHIAHIHAAAAGMLPRGAASSPRGDAFIAGIDRKTGKLATVPRGESMRILLSLKMIQMLSGPLIDGLDKCGCALCVNQRNKQRERREQSKTG